MKVLTYENLKTSFIDFGIKPGMKLIVHSSLKSFGNVEGGADTVIKVLKDIVTEEGIIMMPSFNHGQAYLNGGIFDVNVTPTINGIIPETFRKQVGVLRSVNPTHSFAAWGKNAEYYVKDHQKTDCMGVGSPLYRLMEDGGYCLLLGVTYRSNTFHHCVETCMNVPCLSARGEEYPVRLADGKLITAHTWGWRNSGCQVIDGASYADSMSLIDRKTKIGNSDVTLYKLSEGYKIIADCLKNDNSSGLVCENCSIRPRVCEWTVS